MTETIKEVEYSLKVGRNNHGQPTWLTIRLDEKLSSPPDDRPAHIVYENGLQTERAWYSENRYHRETGPALQRINPNNGIVYYEEYRRFGNMHRSQSEPALIERDPETGKTLRTRYFIGGEEVVPSRPSGLDWSP